MQQESARIVRSHIIISGTGRTGTTFLMQLLTRLGCDTGFTDCATHVHENCNAGMEWDIRQDDAPYIVKSPWLCDYLDDVMQAGNATIEHAFIPVRDLFSAAESRRDVERRSQSAAYSGGIPGGLWYTDNPENQEQALESQLYKLVFALAKHDIPTSLLYFPRIVHDPNYLFKKLSPVFKDLRYGMFIGAYNETSRPELTHRF